jgi:hypothetical protein
MRLVHWLRGICYSGYDRRGNAKYLLGRVADATQCDLEGVPPQVRDGALALLCDSFDIPERQMYCLRRDDELMAIYRSFVGPRFWDNLEFERLGLSLDKLPGPKMTTEEFLTMKTVGDVIRMVAARRGITRQCGGPEPRA